MRSTSNKSGWKIWWKRSIPPTLTEPTVSPWYAWPSATKRAFFGLPRWRQCWKAIFSATSTAVDPESEKKTLLSCGCPSKRGARRASSAASSMAGGEARPSNVVCATFCSCSRMALSISAFRCPCTFTHSEETPSRYLRPSVSNSQAPRAWSMMTGSSPSGDSIQPCICVNGCQRWARSSASSRGVRSCGSSGAAGMFFPMRAVSLPSALSSSRAGPLGRFAQRREEQVEVGGRMRCREGDAEAGGTGRDGGRPDRLHQEAPLAQLGGGGQGGLGSAEDHGEDGSRQIGGKAQRSQADGEPLHVAAQPGPQSVAFDPLEDAHRGERRVRHRGRQPGAEDEGARAVDQQLAAGARRRDVRTER